MSNDLTDWGPATVKVALADYESEPGDRPVPPAAPRPAFERRIGDGPGLGNINIGGGGGGGGFNVDWGSIVSSIAEFGTGAMQAGFQYDLQRRELAEQARAGNQEASAMLAALQDMQSSLTPDSGGGGGMSTGVLVIGGLLILALGGGLIWVLSKK